jgi:hypothetical protein
MYLHSNVVIESAVADGERSVVVHFQSTSLERAAVASKCAVVYCGCVSQCHCPSSVCSVVEKPAATDCCCCLSVHCATHCCILEVWLFQEPAAVKTAAPVTSCAC